MEGGLVLVKAIYENNVLKPLEKLDLEEGDVVSTSECVRPRESVR
jgi:predicted DNA-binding antitoxin AbrB/MazE fold protein